MVLQVNDLGFPSSSVNVSLAVFRIRSLMVFPSAISIAPKTLIFRYGLGHFMVTLLIKFIFLYRITHKIPSVNRFTLLLL